MAEPRRIELMSIDEAPVAKKPRKKEPILRLELTLTESTDQTCPEFSYAELSKSKQVSMIFIPTYSLFNILSIHTK